MIEFFGRNSVIAMIILCALMVFQIGMLVGYQERFEFNHRINPVEIIINQQTNDTTFVYIME